MKGNTGMDATSCIKALILDIILNIKMEDLFYDFIRQYTLFALIMMGAALFLIYRRKSKK